RTFFCSCSSLDEALKFRDQLLRSPLSPLCLEIISPQASEYLSDPPPARDPDEYAPSGPVQCNEAAWQIVVRLSGSDPVMGRCRRELGASVSKELADRDEAQFWWRISHFEDSLFQRHRNALVLYVHVAIQEVRVAANALRQAALDHNFIPA